MRSAFSIPIFAGLALASSSSKTTASPTSSAPFLGPTPPHDGGEFSLGFTLGVGRSAQLLEGFINANNSANDDSIVYLLGIDPQYGGSAAYFNGSAERGLALDFDNTFVRAPDLRRIYGANLPKVEGAGQAEGVRLSDGVQDFDWTVNDGTISHKKVGGKRAFFGELICWQEGGRLQKPKWLTPIAACKRFFNFDDYWLLTFGNYAKDGRTPPKGCLGTRLVQVFDQPGGPAPDPNQ